MSRVVDLGYTVPDTTDRTAIAINAIATAVERLAQHTHSGINSHVLDASSFQNIVQSVDPIDWGTRDTNTGLFTFELSVPLGLDLSVRSPSFANVEDSRVIFLDFIRVGSGVLRITSNFAFQALRIYYA